MDPDGLEVVWSRELQQSRQFQRAMQIVRSSSEGRRVLAALQNVNVAAGVGEGENERVAGHAHVRKHLEGSQRRGYRWGVDTATISIDIDKAARKGATDHELANVIHHELRHIEISLGALPGENLSTMEGVDESERKRNRMDRNLDVYIPADQVTAKGRGIQTLDERNHQFQIEIGLRMSEADEATARHAGDERLQRAREELNRRKAAAGQR
jgi:hypothetical protein